MNVGFFDSGLGGLLILKAVAKALPQYDYIYYGDTANLPYGEKSETEIYELTTAAIRELFLKDCLLVIVACNTASAETLRRIQDTFLKEEYPERRILGVIIPTIETILEGKWQRALLLATTRTVASRKYERELEKVSNGKVELVSVATPELVPLIESHQHDKALAVAIKAIETNGREGDVVLLGCTHYALLKNPLQEHFGSLYTFVSQDEVIPQKLELYLRAHPELTALLSETGKREIYLTEHRPDYDRLIADFLGGAYIAEAS